jgi:hypothetical protein
MFVYNGREQGPKDACSIQFKKQYYERHIYLLLQWKKENNIDIPYGTFFGREGNVI